MNPHGNHKYKSKDEEVRCKVIFQTIPSFLTVFFSVKKKVPGRCMNNFTEKSSILVIKYIFTALLLFSVI